jgi:hypothetical protein
MKITVPPGPANTFRDRLVASVIKAGRCPYGYLKEGQPMAQCPLGFPGCGCADEIELNPFLTEKESEL